MRPVGELYGGGRGQRSEQMVRRPPNCRSHRRGGMTLTELLVAMSILLIGIYAVARGFPSLFGNLEAERVRTEMVRLMEARLERLKAEPERVPEAIAGHDPVTAAVFDPNALPDEDVDPTVGNARDDLTWVLGETFTVPALRPGYDVSIYPLNLGPAIIQDPLDPAAYLQAYRLVRLRRPDMNQQDWETAGRPLEEDQFYLDGAGYLYADPQYESCRVDYAWVDSTGLLHWVQDEVIGNRNVDPAALPVRAADDAKTGLVFANVIAEMASAMASIPYAVAIGQPPTPPTPFPADTVILEGNYGATLFLPPGDSGEVVHINYQLRTEDDSAGNPRRAPIVMEEFSAPTQPPYKVSLGFRGLDDEIPLFENDLLGAPLAAPVYALVVDLLTGATWTDAETWIDLDMIEGAITLNWADPGAPMIPAHAAGHDLRVYYRTLDGNQITVEKAPEYFIERPIMQTYVDSDPTLDESDRVDFRYYEVQPDASDATFTRLIFPASAAGQAVSVDYVVGTLAAGRFSIDRRISGEMHVVDPGTLAITLEEPRDPVTGAVGVVNVRGVSLAVKGWWHGARGRVQMMAIDTYLTPKPLL